MSEELHLESHLDRVQRCAWHRIQTNSYVNGPGPRTVLWLTGCPIHCPGCQNRALWSESEATKHTTPALLARFLLQQAGDQDLTITGGEPFLQPEALWALLHHVRLADFAAGRRRQVVVYTGYTWEDLLDLADAIPAVATPLPFVDLLVDGPYVRAQDDAFVQWRGSRNQRVIDVPASIANGALRDEFRSLKGDVGGDDRLVLVDWDVPTITLAGGGQLLAAAGLVLDLDLDAAGALPIPRCGETGS